MDFKIEFERLLKSEEGETLFKQAAESLGYRTPEQVEELITNSKQPILNKNVQLLKETKEAKEKLKPYKELSENFEKLKELVEDSVGGVDKEALTNYNNLEEVLKKALTSNLDGAEDKARVNKVLQRDFERKSKEFEETQQVLKSREAFISNLLIDDVLKSTLRERDFPETIIKYILPELKRKSSAVVDFEDEKLIARTEDEVDLKDWVKEWAESEEAKQLLPAKVNVGGGSKGSLKNAPKTWQDMNLDERIEIYKKSPEQAKALRG